MQAGLKFYRAKAYNLLFYNALYSYKVNSKGISAEFCW